QGYILVNNRNYPQIAGDYVKTFALLKALPVDLFLGAHGAYFNLKEKLPKINAGGANPLIDPGGYKAYIAEREQAFEKELAKQTVEAHTDAAVSFDLAWDHVALSVPSIPESIAWYEKMLGFKEIRRGGQPTGQQTALIRRGTINIELFQLPNAAPLPESRKNPSEDFRTHGLKHFGFEVKNLPAVLAELKAKGVKMAFEMRDNPNTAFAFISDNAGNAIELIEHKTR
ncbi:MAG TPA: VOC family protein, partial [Xanthobacteraceae bacterium]|nr:VOC family protein [Xanthobacteraceae bacterium]